MNKNIEKESQSLIDNFNEVTGDDKAQAMVVISTLTDDSDRLSILCAGTASMMMSIQAAALAQNFNYLVKNGAIEKPMLLMMDIITDLTRQMDESIQQAREKNSNPNPNLHQAAGKH